MIDGVELVSPARQDAALGSSARSALAVSGDLLVFELLQRHCSERSNVAHATLRKLDDLPSNEMRCGVVCYLQAQRIADAFKRLRRVARD